MTLLRIAGALLLVAAAAGCDTDPNETTATPAERAIQIPGLTATLEQYREDEINGLMSVQTTNRSSTTVELRDLRLRWPGLTDEAQFDSPTRLAPGVTYDIRVRQGDARCGSPPRADGAPPPGGAVARAAASIDGAAPVAVEIPVHDTRAVLPRVFQQSCQDQRGAWAADLHFGDSWTPSTTASGKPAMDGTIELRRREAEEPLTVTQLNGSVLLRINPVTASDPVAVLAPGQDAGTIPIRIEQSGNCAAHALIESKKSFIIPIGFAVGDDAPFAYVIRFDIPTQRLLFRIINEQLACEPSPLRTAPSAGRAPARRRCCAGSGWCHPRSSPSGRRRTTTSSG